MDERLLLFKLLELKNQNIQPTSNGTTTYISTTGHPYAISLTNTLRQKYIKRALKWTTKSGEKILVQYLDDSHLEGIQDHLLCRGSKFALSKSWLEIIKYEKYRRCILGIHIQNGLRNPFE